MGAEETTGSSSTSASASVDPYMPASPLMGIMTPYYPQLESVASTISASELRQRRSSEKDLDVQSTGVDIESQITRQDGGNRLSTQQEEGGRWSWLKKKAPVMITGVGAAGIVFYIVAGPK